MRTTRPQRGFSAHSAAYGLCRNHNFLCLWCKAIKLSKEQEEQAQHSLQGCCAYIQPRNFSQLFKGTFALLCFFLNFHDTFTLFQLLTFHENLLLIFEFFSLQKTFEHVNFVPFQLFFQFSNFFNFVNFFKPFSHLLTLSHTFSHLLTPFHTFFTPFSHLFQTFVQTFSNLFKPFQTSQHLKT